VHHFGSHPTHGSLAALLRHEHASLALAQRCSEVPASLPLFSALLNYRHSVRAAADALSGWEGIELLGSEERTNYPVTLLVDDLGEAFELTVQVQASIGAERVCGFMRTALGHLAEALERAPGTPAQCIEVLPESERHQLLVTWNATDADYPRDRCIHELFEAQAARTPEAVAVAFEDHELTYGELNVRANRLAHHLRGLGVGPDSLVAMVLERSAELITAELAILKCGSAYVPIDPALPGERQAFMIGDCQAKLVLAAKGASLPEGLAAMRLDIDDQMLAGGIAGNPNVELDSEAAAYVMYTSGSTGRPTRAIRLRNICPTHWRRYVATRPDAIPRAS
jgi:non-ribosomal peptide synthetase component F